MKALVKMDTKVDGNKFTITGEIMDVNFPNIIAQRVTIHHPAITDTAKPRQVQATSHGIVVVRHGSAGVLLPQDEIVSALLEIDSTLTDPPVFEQHPTADNIAGKIKSEIPVAAMIQHSDDGKTWTDTDLKLDSTIPCGKHYRVVAANKCGKSESNPVHIPHPKAK